MIPRRRTLIFVGAILIGCIVSTGRHEAQYVAKFEAMCRADTARSAARE
jgi:hypothetical protein